MEQAKEWFSKQNDSQKKIVLLAGILIGLMILFPPKVITTSNPLLGGSVSESAGYHFLFADPAGEKKAAARLLLGDEVDKYISSGIAWGRLFVQLAIVGGAAAFFLNYTRRNPSAYRRENGEAV